MNKSLLFKWLSKQGIENLDPQTKSNPKGITEEEKQTFLKYEQILSRETLTLEDLQKFLSQQILAIEGKWKDLDASNEKKAQLIPYHSVYSTILSAINAPQIERSILENYLLNLTK